MNKILLVFGTRPELIKLAPLIKEFSYRNLRDQLFVVYTSQHSNYINQDLDYFDVVIDYQFNLIRKDDSLSLLNGSLLLEFNTMIKKAMNSGIMFTALIAQGDTCTTYSAAQFAFYQKIPLIHVEAGLRTFDFSEPFPEEFYRKTISSMAFLHFAPTITAQRNLLQEGVVADAIIVSGNTAIDNFKELKNSNSFKNIDNNESAIVLMTIHRRENIKEQLQVIISRIQSIIVNHPHKTFVWIDNPGYKLKSKLSQNFPNLKVIEPVAFSEMIELYKKTELIITDSGGIQEEAAYLSIPVVLYRRITERTEGNIIGISKYLEEEDESLDVIISKLKDSRKQPFNTIYGDGKACIRILDYLTGMNFVIKPTS